MKFFQKNLGQNYINNCDNIEDMRRLYPIHMSERPNGKGEKSECKIPFNSNNKFVAYLLDYKEDLDNTSSPTELFVAFKVSFYFLFLRVHQINLFLDVIVIYSKERNTQWMMTLRTSSIKPMKL
jgi:hypothetical protein